MPKTSAKSFLIGFRVTLLGTLTSRVLGLARDVATAALLGAGGGAVDALLVALQLPNLFRRLFAEGVLTAAYLPRLVARLEEDRLAAQRLAGTSCFVLSIGLALAVLVGELVLHSAGATQPQSSTAQVAALLSILLPYLLLICVTAHLAATLHALRHFTWPALASVILNIVWLVTLLAVAPAISDQTEDQVVILAWGIVVAGGLQVASQWFALWRLGFLPLVDFASSWQPLKKIAAATAPAMFCLSALQINTFVDAWTAWLLSSGIGEGSRWQVEPGAASLLYYSERLYMLPVGLVGLAVATVAFPKLAADAAAGRREEAAADLATGLRLILLLALPASAGLWMLALPIVRLLLEHGAFDLAQSQRSAAMVATYGCGVWAFCSLPLAIRAMLAFGAHAAAAAVSLLAIAANCGLNLLLLFWWGEQGLVLATVLAAVLQLSILGAAVHRQAPLPAKPLLASLGRTIAATTVMTIAGLMVLPLVTAGDTLLARAAAVLVPLVICVCVYFSMHWLFGASDLKLLRQALSRRK